MAEALHANEIERRKGLWLAYQQSDEYQEKLRTRLQVNDACEKKPEAKGITWNLCARPDNPAEGCIFFIETFGWTFDPRPQAIQSHLPFFLYEYQKDTVRWLIDQIESGNDGLVEKSRDMGMSWIIFAYVPLWYWFFKDGSNLLLGSYKQDLVDNRTKDSLFGMIDYALDNMPKWLMPRGYKKDKHRNQMKLVNPANGNLITGDTMNPDFGRGARKTAVLFDELGSWDYAKDAWESCGDVTACRIANSTPKGHNYYKKLRDSGISLKTFHWSLHPLKDEQWYESECARRTEEEVAQELDISYNKSQEGRVYPEWNEENVELGIFEYDDTKPLYVGWDFGKTDDTAIIWCQRDRDGLRIVDTYRNAGKTIDFYIPFINGIVPSESYNYTPKDMDIIARHREYGRATHFGDPAGRFGNQVVNSSVLDVLRQSGIMVNFKDSWKEFQKRKTAAKLLIRDGIFLNKNENTEHFGNCMTQATYPRVTSEGQKEVRSVKPKHDWTSHYRSSFEYLALGLSEMTMRRAKPYDKFKKKEYRNPRRTLSY